MYRTYYLLVLVFWGSFPAMAQLKSAQLDVIITSDRFPQNSHNAPTAVFKKGAGLENFGVKHSGMLKPGFRYVLGTSTRFSNGETFTGFFSYNYYDGYGIKKTDRSNIQEGLWINNQLVEEFPVGLKPEIFEKPEKYFKPYSLWLEGKTYDGYAWFSGNERNDWLFVFGMVNGAPVIAYMGPLENNRPHGKGFLYFFEEKTSPQASAFNRLHHASHYYGEFSNGHFLKGRKWVVDYGNNGTRASEQTYESVKYYCSRLYEGNFQNFRIIGKGKMLENYRTYEAVFPSDEFAINAIKEQPKGFYLCKGCFGRNDMLQYGSTEYGDKVLKFANASDFIKAERAAGTVPSELNINDALLTGWYNEQLARHKRNQNDIQQAVAQAESRKKELERMAQGELGAFVGKVFSVNVNNPYDNSTIKSVKFYVLGYEGKMLTGILEYSSLAMVIDKKQVSQHAPFVYAYEKLPYTNFVNQMPVGSCNRNMSICSSCNGNGNSSRIREKVETKAPSGFDKYRSNLHRI